MQEFNWRQWSGLQPFIYCLITGILIYAWEWLPSRRLVLIPTQEEVQHSIYSDVLTDSYWIDEDKLSFACDIPADGNGHMCGFNIHFAPLGTQGIDLSYFEFVHIYLRYEGNDPQLRFHIRNFEPGFSDINNIQTFKFNNVLIATQYVNQLLTINLSEMSVAEWWISEYKVPRDRVSPNFHHALAFGVDLSYPGAPGKHTFEMQSVEFVGYWIEREHWYLGIMLIWILIIIIYGVLRLVGMARAIHRANSQNYLLISETDKYKKLSTQDQLTNLLNRHGVTEYLDQQDFQDIQLAMLVIDVDFFKRINDNFGHPAGDEVLKKIAEIIQDHIKDKGHAGRWGGEEFVILMENMDIESAFDLAERLRLSVANEKFSSVNNEMVTISIGVGATSEVLPFDQLFRQVDLALYRAKASGRNCTRLVE